MNEEYIDAQELLDRIDSDSYGDMLIIAAQLLENVGTKNGKHYPASRIIFDLLEAISFDSVKEAMFDDYRIN